MALRITDSGHLFYITQDKVLRFLKFGTRIPKEILTDVKIRQNGKNLRVYDDLLIIQQGDLFLFKLQVTQNDKITSQRFKLSEGYGVLKDFDYFMQKPDLVYLEDEDDDDENQFSLTAVKSRAYRPAKNIEFEGVIVSLTSKGSLQIIDPKKKSYQLHPLKKKASNFCYLFSNPQPTKGTLR